MIAAVSWSAGLLALVSASEPAQPDSGSATPTATVELEDRMGEPIAADVQLTDRFGERTSLAEVLSPDMPTVVILAYYRCPMLCDLVLRGTAEALGKLDWVPGEDYQIVTVSFDPKDTPPKAEQARSSTIDVMGIDVDAEDWPFLVGAESEVRRLADSLGFDYRYDPKTDQYAHPAAVFVATPEGRLARVIPGVDPEPLDLRLALLEAGDGTIGNPVEHALLTCYRYDPSTRRYGPFVWGFLRLGAIVILLTAGATFWALRRHEARAKEARRG